jgi:hypothetical protein
MDMIDEDMAHAVSYGAAQERARAVFAPADNKLIKDALLYYVKYNQSISVEDEKHATNLLHRLGRIDGSR